MLQIQHREADDAVWSHADMAASVHRTDLWCAI